MSEQTQMQQEKPKHGTFCWMELSSTNVEPCKEFYKHLFGWNLTSSDVVPGFEYTEFGADEKRLGGMFQMTEECAAMTNGEKLKSHWMPYVAVDNVDDTASRVRDLGGSICVPPTDIPNVGRFSVIQDPSGATISILTLKY